MGRAVYGWSCMELSLARADCAMLVDPAGAYRKNSRRETALLLALGLGFVSGLRTFTPVAAVLLVRGGIWRSLPSVSTSGMCCRILPRGRKPWGFRLASSAGRSWDG